VDRLRGLINEFEDLASLLRAALIGCAPALSRVTGTRSVGEGRAKWNLSRDETGGTRGSVRAVAILTRFSKQGTLPREEAASISKRRSIPRSRTSPRSGYRGGMIHESVTLPVAHAHSARQRERREELRFRLASAHPSSRIHAPAE